MQEEDLEKKELMNILKQFMKMEPITDKILEFDESRVKLGKMMLYTCMDAHRQKMTLEDYIEGIKKSWDLASKLHETLMKKRK